MVMVFLMGRSCHGRLAPVTGVVAGYDRHVPAQLPSTLRGVVGLCPEDLDWLHQLIADWQVIADLSVSDLVLWARTQTGRFVTVAHSRPVCRTDLRRAASPRRPCTEKPAPGAAARAGRAGGSMGVPVYMLPGNHDPLTPETVYTQVQAKAPAPPIRK